MAIQEDVQQKPFDINLALDQIEMGCETDTKNRPRCCFVDSTRIGRESACRHPEGWKPCMGTMKCANYRTWDPTAADKS